MTQFPASALTRLALRLGLLVPIIYYGIQAAAAPFFPEFSFNRVTASELGSDRSPVAWLFNGGIFTQGVFSLIASIGFFAAFRRQGVHPALAILTCAALALNGVQTLWAGWFPMPDPRHGGHPVFIIGMLGLPVLLAASMWKASGSAAIRTYFLLNLLGLAAVAPFMAGATGIDLSNYRGLLQRIFTLTIFPPIGVAALTLLHRTRSSAEIRNIS